MLAHVSITASVAVCLTDALRIGDNEGGSKAVPPSLEFQGSRPDVESDEADVGSIIAADVEQLIEHVVEAVEDDDSSDDNSNGSTEVRICEADSWDGCGGYAGDQAMCQHMMGSGSNRKGVWEVCQTSCHEKAGCQLKTEVPVESGNNAAPAGDGSGAAPGGNGICKADSWGGCAAYAGDEAKCQHMLGYGDDRIGIWEICQTSCHEKLGCQVSVESNNRAAPAGDGTCQADSWDGCATYAGDQAKCQHMFGYGSSRVGIWMICQTSCHEKAGCQVSTPVAADLTGGQSGAGSEAVL